MGGPSGLPGVVLDVWKPTGAKAEVIKQMKDFIYNYGSLASAMNIFSDFYGYRGGVYSYSKQGDYTGTTSVKIVGWGVDPTDGVEYWRVGINWMKKAANAGEYTGEYVWVKVGDSALGLEFNYRVRGVVQYCKEGYEFSTGPILYGPQYGHFVKIRPET